MAPTDRVTRAAELASRIIDELVAVRRDDPNELMESAAALHDDLSRYADRLRRGQREP